MPGFPIRTPWDHSLVDSSPRPIAASHVLHRLLVPRHPPSALDNLTTENKMLASTVQFSTNDQPTTHTSPTSPETSDGIGNQIVPGTETTTSRRNADSRLFLQDPTGCCVCSPSPAASPNHFPHRRHPEAPAAVLTRKTVAGSGWPVSPPLSTPVRRSRTVGSCVPFGTRCSLERR